MIESKSYETGYNNGYNAGILKGIELQDWQIKKPVVHTWVDLTVDNWKEHRDCAVWMRGNSGGDTEDSVELLVYADFTGDWPFMNASGQYQTHCSIYNNQGIKAEFKEGE